MTYVVLHSLRLDARGCEVHTQDWYGEGPTPWVLVEHHTGRELGVVRACTWALAIGLAAELLPDATFGCFGDVRPPRRRKMVRREES